MKPRKKAATAATKAPAAKDLKLNAHELALLQRNRALADMIDARKRLMFSELERKLARWEEELVEAVSGRLGVDPEGYHADLETGQLTPRR